MKQTKFLIVSLAVALLFLGFSLGFYVTNQGTQIELPTEAAFIQVTENDLLAEEEGSVDATNQMALGENGVIAQEDAAVLIFEESLEELPDEPEEVSEEEMAVIAEPLVVISPEKETVVVNQPLSGGVWKLASLGGASPKGGYEMFAKSSARFGGETPCNTFFGEYGVVDGLTRVRGFGDTGLVCGAEEAMFLEIVSKGVFSYDEVGRLLVASDAGVLVFSQ